MGLDKMTWHDAMTKYKERMDQSAFQIGRSVGYTGKEPEQDGWFRQYPKPYLDGYRWGRMAAGFIE